MGCSNRRPHWVPLLSAKNLSYSLHRLTKIGRQKIGKMLPVISFCCNIVMVGSKFGKSTAWIPHVWCHLLIEMVDIFFAQFGLLSIWESFHSHPLMTILHPSFDDCFYLKMLKFIKENNAVSDVSFLYFYLFVITSEWWDVWWMLSYMTILKLFTSVCSPICSL